MPESALSHPYSNSTPTLPLLGLHISNISIFCLLPVVEGAMSESPTDDATSENVLFILAVSVSSVVTLIVVVFVCLCCQWLYKTDDEHSDDEDSEAELSPYRDTTSTGRDDLKTLRHHSWKERVKAPFLTRKTIRFVG